MTHYRTDNTAQLICYMVHKDGEKTGSIYNTQVGGDTLSPNKVKLIKDKLAKEHHTSAFFITIINVIPMGWNGEG